MIPKRNKTNGFVALMFCGIIACQNQNNLEDPKSHKNNKETYFSLKNYFEEESKRLAKNYGGIEKTAQINSKTETKTIKIENWSQELDAFIQSDINKPAWKSSYSIERDSSQNLLIYKSTDPKLTTKKITIKKDSDDDVIAVLIEKLTENNLYTTKENLEYYPDSLYIIETTQAVRLLGKNSYKIVGYFKLSR